jgi:hypothetical protein
VTYFGKPTFHHPSTAVNELGYRRRDCEGSMSTLCAGCGHDAISAAIIHACFELSLPPHRIAKLSGNRLLLHNADLHAGSEPRLQFGARADAIGADGRQSR